MTGASEVNSSQDDTDFKSSIYALDNKRVSLVRLSLARTWPTLRPVQIGMLSMGVEVAFLMVISVLLLNSYILQFRERLGFLSCV